MRKEWLEVRIERAPRLQYGSYMALTLDQIVEETRQMPPDVVAELVDRIMIARHGGLDAGIESAWKLEVQRRNDHSDYRDVRGEHQR